MIANLFDDGRFVGRVYCDEGTKVITFEGKIYVVGSNYAPNVFHAEKVYNVTGLDKIPDVIVINQLGKDTLLDIISKVLGCSPSDAAVKLDSCVYPNFFCVRRWGDDGLHNATLEFGNGETYKVSAKRVR